MISPRIAYLEYCSEYQKPFIAYRLPFSNEHITLIFDKKDIIEIKSYDEIIGKQGFIFTPFDTEKEKSYFITPKEVLTNDKGFRGDLFLDKTKEKNLSYIESKDESKEEYQKKFQNLQELLKSKKLEKIVFSRTITLPNIPTEEHLYAYHNLTTSYPQAMVYWVHIPQIGIEWMGATPEVLVKKDKDKLQTVALAGTKKPHENWTAKEYEEQQMVANYINDILSDFTPEMSETQTIDTGTVQHLATYFTFCEQNNVFEQILEHLHPTPAICGLPQKEAFKAILQTEKHARKYYCGFLGPININDTTATFVNLRCMELSPQNICIYVGGGLTSSSDEEREWQETERKADTLRNILL